MFLPCKEIKKELLGGVGGGGSAGMKYGLLALGAKVSSVSFLPFRPESSHWTFKMIDFGFG